jgi:hypothetical protein
MIFISSRGGWTNHNIWWSITGRNPIIHKMNTRLFSRGSCAYQHANPRCVDHHFVVRRLIGSLKPSSPRELQEPTASELTQWHEQFTRVAFGAPPEKAQHPSQITERPPRISTTLATTPPLPPNCLGGSNHQEKQEFRSQRSPKCQLDANSEANTLEITQSHFDLSIKQGRWVEKSMLSSRGC